MEHHIVTGATGFVGAALTLELLDQTSGEIHCLVRAKDGEAPTERLEQTLSWSASLYGREELLSDVQARCRAIPFDLRDPVGTTVHQLPEKGEFWHAAASLKFKDADRAEIELQNVDGTQNVLALAARTHSEMFNYFSTAYVAGRRTGTILEEVNDDPGVANNAYEASKIRAESLVHTFPAVATRIFRPSVVIGDSATYAALSGAGLYGMIRGIHRVKTEVTDRLGDFLSHRRLRLRFDGDAPINLVPVDAVVRNSVGISQSATQARVFHLANAEPPSVDRVAKAICGELGMLPPSWVDDDAEFTSIDDEFDKEPRTEFFRSYLSSTREFDQTNTHDVLGRAATTCPLEEDALRNYVRWYIEFLNELRRRREEGAYEGSRTPAASGGQ